MLRTRQSEKITQDKIIYLLFNQKISYEYSIYLQFIFICKIISTLTAFIQSLFPQYREYKYKTKYNTKWLHIIF